MRAAKVQASLRIRAVSPEPSLLAHTSSESRGTFRQKARSLAALNGWACAVKICHIGMLEDTNSLDGAHTCITVGCQSTSLLVYDIVNLVTVSLLNVLVTIIRFVLEPIGFACVTAPIHLNSYCNQYTSSRNRD